MLYARSALPFDHSTAPVMSGGGVLLGAGAAGGTEEGPPELVEAWVVGVGGSFLNLGSSRRVDDAVDEGAGACRGPVGALSGALSAYADAWRGPGGA